RPAGRCEDLCGTGLKTWTGDPGPGSDAARCEDASGEGDCTGNAALVGTVRPWTPLPSASGNGMASSTSIARTAQPLPLGRLRLTNQGERINSATQNPREDTVRCY